MNDPVAIADLAGLVKPLAQPLRAHVPAHPRHDPHRWLLTRRIERAKTLLKGSLPLVEVASTCGFVDQSHFTKVFRGLEGVTPGAWRGA